MPPDDLLARIRDAELAEAVGAARAQHEHSADWWRGYAAGAADAADDEYLYPVIVEELVSNFTAGWLALFAALPEEPDHD